MLQGGFVRLGNAPAERADGESSWIFVAARCISTTGPDCLRLFDYPRHGPEALKRLLLRGASGRWPGTGLSSHSSQERARYSRDLSSTCDSVRAN